MMFDAITTSQNTLKNLNWEGWSFDYTIKIVNIMHIKLSTT